MIVLWLCSALVLIALFREAHVSEIMPKLRHTPAGQRRLRSSMARSVRQVWSRVDEDQPVTEQHLEETPVETVALRAQQQPAPLAAPRFESTDEDTPTRSFMPPPQQQYRHSADLSPIPIPTAVPVPPCTMRRRVSLAQTPPLNHEPGGPASAMPHVTHHHVPVDSAMRASILASIPVFNSTTAFPWEDAAVAVPVANQVPTVLRSITNFFLRLDRQLDSLQASPENCLQILRTKIMGVASHSVDHFVQNLGDHIFTHLDYLSLRSSLIVSFTPADYDTHLEARLRSVRQAADSPILAHLHSFKTLIDCLREGDVYRAEIGQLKLKRIFENDSVLIFSS